MKRGSEYNRKLREHGLTKRMASTLDYLADRGAYTSVRLNLADAMSAVGLQRHGLARSFHEDANRRMDRRRAGLGWAVTERGIAVAAELRMARREDAGRE